MQITTKRLKEIIAEEMEKLNENSVLYTEPGFVAVIEETIKKYGVTQEEALSAVKVAFNQTIMNETPKRKK